MPQAIPVAMIAITIASTAYSVAGSIQSGQQQAAMAEAQGKQAAMHGEMANLQARSQAAEMQNQETRLRATQVAQAAANGVSLDSDSFLNVVAATASKAELDRAQVLRNGLLARRLDRLSSLRILQPPATIGLLAIPTPEQVC